MLEGKDLILATKDFAVEVRSKSWWLTLSTIVCLGAAFFCALYPFHLGVRIPASIVAGLLLVRMFVIYHDYQHHTILKGSKLANAIFTFFGLYILAPKSIWKRSHDYHHKHNSKLHSSSIGSFPIITRQQYNELSKGQRTMYLFSRHPVTIAFGYIFAFIYGMCIQSLMNNRSKHWDSALSLLIHFSIGATLLFVFGWLPFLLGFLLPSMIAGAIGSYLFYAQHNFPGVEFYSKEDWTYSKAALNSSSYMKMSRVMHWFTANIGYHHIHHTNARIPFYRLPETHKAFKAFEAAKTTSLLPLEIVRCLVVKAWDPELGRMVKRNELG